MPDYDPLDSDARAQRAEERAMRDRLEKSEEQVDIASLMGEQWGRRVVHRMLDRAGVFRTSHVKGDPYETAFREGERNVGNWLLAQIVAETPEQYAAMLKENTNAR